MIEAHALHPTRILAWCLMRNHWHFVLWPREEGEVTAFLRWLAHTHAMRWHVAHGTVGRGHLYQGRFKSFPVQEDGHVLTVCRYVERNALQCPRCAARGGLALGELVGAAERPAGPAIAVERLAGGAACSLAAVGQPALDGKGSVRPCGPAVARGRPYGDDDWQQKQVKRLGLLHTMSAAKGVRQRPRESGGRKTSCVPVSTADGKGARGPADVGCPGASLWG